LKFEKLLLPFFSFILFIGFWYFVLALKNYPSFILPSPHEVLFRFYQSLLNGSLLFHGFITLKEIFLGLFIGFSLSFSLGFVLAKFKSFKLLLSPLIIAFQAVPIIALAPLLVIWLGTGIWSKVFVCAATLFFPVLINTITGFSNINPNYYDLFASLEANFFQKLKYLEIPAGLAVFFAGLKIGVVLSVIGAVVGEFVSADKGLGYLINLASGLYDTPLRFAAFFSLSIIALLLYFSIGILEKLFIKWK
jgi:NitT/TauT family transport system permease protein